LLSAAAIASLNGAVDVDACDYFVDAYASVSGEGYALTIDEFMRLYGPDAGGAFPPEPGSSVSDEPLHCGGLNLMTNLSLASPVVAAQGMRSDERPCDVAVLRLRGGAIDADDDVTGCDESFADTFVDDALDDPGSWAYGRSAIISAIPGGNRQHEIALLSGLGIKDPPIAVPLVSVFNQYDRPRVMRVDPRCHSRFLVGDQGIPDPRYFAGFLSVDMETRVDVVAVPPGVVRPGPFRDANDRQFSVPLMGKLRRYYLDRLVLVKPNAFKTVPLLAAGVRVADVPVLVELGDRIIAIKPHSIVPPEALSLYPPTDTMTFDEYVATANPEMVRVATEAIASSLAQFAETQYALHE
jgi:hypothetical protein